MARKKNIKTKAKTPKPVKKVSAKKIDSKKPIQSSEKLSKNIYQQLRLDESYVSLLIGAGVVVIIAFLLFFFVKQSPMNSNVSIPTPTTQPTKSVPKTVSYTLKYGEGLWDVAVKFYGDGYKWTDIASANNLDEYSANNVTPGTVLIIPNAK